MALGAVFLAVKAVEYAAEIDAGWGLGSGGFVTLYFLVTGFHALHVVMGIAILAIVAHSARSGAVETGAAFWHMVDLVWLLVFPTVYLVR
jgi:nitric oxide reductase NorE protein